MMGISSGLSVAIYWIGAYVINDAAPTARLPLFSDMIVFMSYAMAGCHGIPSLMGRSSSFFLELWSLLNGFNQGF